jgi:hypothetical protein
MVDLLPLEIRLSLLDKGPLRFLGVLGLLEAKPPRVGISFTTSR